jgi:secreted trypsin-like serine protease
LLGRGGMHKAIGWVVAIVVIAGMQVASASGIEAPVVGGTRVPAGKWPDVAVVISRDSTCTGTLIAPDVVLTAGHCIGAEAPIEVIIGTVNYGLPGTGERIAVAWARTYPSWDERYDIAVLKLAARSKAEPRKIAAVCDTRVGLVGGALVHIVGFGLATEAGTDRNTALREADMPVLDPTCTMDAACQASIAPHGEFIAGGNGVDACFGDSGGPIYLLTDDGWALVGVVSRGLAVPGLPCGEGGVYVRADKVVSWVQSVTGVRLGRTSCSGPADGIATDDDAGAGGCSSGAGSAGLAAILGVVVCCATRRRRPRPDHP